MQSALIIEEGIMIVATGVTIYAFLNSKYISLPLARKISEYMPNVTKSEKKTITEKQKIVKEEELSTWLSQGWIVKIQLKDGTIIIEQP